LGAGDGSANFFVQQPTAICRNLASWEKGFGETWPPEDRGDSPATLDVVLTEFADPSGIATYFRLPDGATTVNDELVSEK
jgi:hypothetical protein